MGVWKRFKWPNGVGNGYSRGYKLLVPRFVRRSGGGWGVWLRGRPTLLAHYARQLRYYTSNCYLDVRAKANGECSAYLLGCYAFWRCRRPAGHRMPHRYNNYTWVGYGPPLYDPIDYHAGHQHWPSWPVSTERHNTRNFRQWRHHRAEMRSARERIKA